MTVWAGVDRPPVLVSAALEIPVRRISSARAAAIAAAVAMALAAGGSTCCRLSSFVMIFRLHHACVRAPRLLEIAG